MWASVHLDKDQNHNLLVRNTEVFEIQPMFSITQNQIHSLDDKEVFGLNTIDWGLSPWRSCTLAHEHIVKQLKAKLYVFSDSVLCLGGNGPVYPKSSEPWANIIWYYTSTSQYRELDNIGGAPVVFEWKMFPGHTTLDLLRKVRVDVQRH